MSLVQGRDRHLQGGFTLIELLDVIVILGVVAAMVVFAVGASTDKGLKSACKTDMKPVEVAAEAYRSDHDAYTDIPGLVAAKLLRAAPETTHYVISVDTTTGAVTADHNNCDTF